MSYLLLHVALLGINAYVLFAREAYQEMADEARARGWPVRHIPGEHLHQIVDPAAVTDELISLAS